MYAAFKRQTDSFINNVRPENNKSKKFQLWGAATKSMANDLAVISANSVTDQKLLEMRQALQDQAERMATMLLDPQAAENFQAISQEGGKLSQIQEAFDNYTKAQGY
jgi:DNA-binding FadR family transcriptional regulator